MSAREVIARAMCRDPDECIHGSGSVSIPDGRSTFECHLKAWEAALPRATAIIEALTAAGIDLVPRDENHKATVDPASTVYGTLLHRHLEEARRDSFGVRRAQLFDFIEAYRGEFPAECQAWEDRSLIKEDGE